MSRHRRWGLVAGLLATAVITSPLPLAGPVRADEPTNSPSVPGEFVVELKSDADAEVINAAVGGVAAPERTSGSSELWLFRLDAATDPIAGTKLIRNASGVVDAQPNVLAHLPEFFGGRRIFWTDWEPADSSAPASAARVKQPGLGSAGLPADPAHGATGEGTVVAVLDTGLDAAHPVFADGVAGGYDLVADDPFPAEELNGLDDSANGLIDEAYGHGTYVAGIVRLVAPDARILPIRILDSDGVTTAWRILQGLDLAVAAGADIVNLSLGGPYLGDVVDDGFERLEKVGVAVVAAAGNEATTELRYPAAASGVVGVTAIDGQTGDVATFSNTGSWIDVAAPGVRVVSAFPDGRYATWGGTSASAPVVTGTLALLRSIMPTADVDDVVDRMTSTADADGLSNVSSYGRIDVAAAVVRAING